jgi:hypothetical protein
MDSVNLSVVNAVSAAQKESLENSVSIAVLKKSLDIEQQVMTQLLGSVVAAGGAGQLASPPPGGAVVDIKA